MNNISKKGMAKITLSKWVIIFIAVFWYLAGVGSGQWQRKFVIKSDVINYYVYLPAALIHGDLTMRWTSDERGKEARDAGNLYSYSENDQPATPQMTIGMSIMYLPFFLLATIFSWLLGFEINGYNEVYAYFVAFSSFFYGLMGLWYARKVLLIKFSEVETAIALFILSCATNLYSYSVFNGGMPHSTSFALITVLMYYTIKFFQFPKVRSIVIIGLVMGLIILIRPINIIIVLFPLLYGVYSTRDITARFKFLESKKLLILIGVLMAFLVLLPQLILWKTMTGQFIYNSYGENNVFFWSHPHIIDGLFSYRKGWLLYTPIMTLALIGMFFLKSYYKEMVLVVPIVICLVIYVTFSWWCWWYGGSFGCRPIIDYYGLLIIPLAALIKYFHQRGKVLILGIPILLFGFLNIFQTSQANSSLLHWEAMSKDAYWAIFLMHPDKRPENYENLLSHPNSKKAFEEGME